MQIIDSIQTLSANLCVYHFPAILNSLTNFITSDDKDIARSASRAFFYVIRKAREASNEKPASCNSLLLFYVRYMLDCKPGSKVPFHENFCKYWLEIINDNDPNSNSFVNLEKGDVWILLDIVLKSMIQTLCRKPFRADSRLICFPSSFTSVLKNLCLTLFCTNREIKNMDILTLVPCFMKDLLGLIDRGTVFEMVNNFNFITK